MQLSDDPELIAKISYFLGIIYSYVKWHKMKGRMAFDIFEHRLEVASYQDSVPSLLKKLCNGLSLQAPSISLELLEYLDHHQENVLMLIRQWPQYFVYRASYVSKLLRKKKVPEEIISQIINELKKPKK